jgi:hypothetical protein
MDRDTIEQRLLESHEIQFPLDLDKQYAVVFALRRMYALVLVLYQKIERLQAHNRALDLMIQEWIIENPSRNKDH